MTAVLKFAPIKNRRFHALATTDIHITDRVQLKNESLELYLDPVFELNAVTNTTHQLTVVGHTDIQSVDILRVELEKMLGEDGVVLVKVEFSEIPEEYINAYKNKKTA